MPSSILARSYSPLANTPAQGAICQRQIRAFFFFKTKPPRSPSDISVTSRKNRPTSLDFIAFLCFPRLSCLFFLFHLTWRFPDYDTKIISSSAHFMSRPFNFINKIKGLDFLFCSGSRFANTPAGICSGGGKSEIYKKRQNHDTDSS